MGTATHPAEPGFFADDGDLKTIPLWNRHDIGVTRVTRLSRQDLAGGLPEIRDAQACWWNGRQPIPPQGAYCGDSRSFQSHDGLITESQGNAEANAALAERAAGVKAVGANGTNQHSDGFDESDCVKPSSKGGNSATYRLAKLKRDYPDVAKRVEAGEFKTVAEAERAAGSWDRGRFAEPVQHVKPRYVGEGTASKGSKPSENLYPAVVILQAGTTMKALSLPSATGHSKLTLCARTAALGWYVILSYMPDEEGRPFMQNDQERVYLDDPEVRLQLVRFDDPLNPKRAWLETFDTSSIIRVKPEAPKPAEYLQGDWRKEEPQHRLKPNRIPRKT